MLESGYSQKGAPRVLHRVISYFTYLNLSLLILGFMSFRPVADDYCFAKHTLDKGVFSTIAFYLTNWTPLYTSYSLQIFPTGIINSRHTLMFTEILVLLLIVLYAKYILQFQTKDFFRNTNAIFAVAIGLLVFVGLSFSPGSAFFFLFGWPGTFFVHTLPFCLLVLLVLTVESNQHRKFLFSSILVFILSGTGTLAVLFSAISLIFLSVYNLIVVKHVKFKAYLLHGISILLIQVILYLTPGNSARFGDNELRIDSFLEIIKSEELQFRVLYLMKWHISNSLSFVSLTLVILIGMCLHNFLRTSRRNYLYLFLTFLFLYSTFISLTTLVETLTYDAIWHSIFPMMFLYLSVLMFGSLIGAQLGSFLGSIKHLFPSVIISVQLFLLVSIYQFTLPQVERSSKWDDRIIEQKATSIPPRDFNGNQLLADTEQTWVLDCFSTSQ